MNFLYKLTGLLIVLSLGARVFAQKNDITAIQDEDVKSGVYYDNVSEKVQRETILNGSTTFFNHFLVHVIYFKPGVKFRGKGSEFENLIIVKEGQLKVTLNKKTKVIGPGSVIFFIPGKTFRIENVGNEPLKIYMIDFISKLPMNQDRAIANGGSFIIDWNDIQSKDTDRGNRRDFFNRPTASCSKYEMHVTTLNEGLASHLPHTHAEEEIILLLKGEINMEIDEKLLPATPGALIFLPSKVPHALHNTGKGACQYFAFQWKNEG